MISTFWSMRRYYGYLALVLLCGWLWLSKNGTEKELLKVKGEYASLNSLVQVQNDQIAALELRTQTQREIAEREIAAAKKVNAGHQSKAQRILSAAPRGNECDAALQLMKEFGR